MVYNITIDGEINIALARNMLVEYASKHGFEYISMIDDDFEIQNSDFYETMFEILIEEDADIEPFQDYMP